MSERTRQRHFETQADAAAPPEPRCGNCHFFCDQPAHLDAQLPQLRTLGSVYGSVRSRDGLCEHQQRYLMASSHCAAFQPRPPMLAATRPAVKGPRLLAWVRLT